MDNTHLKTWETNVKQVSQTLTQRPLPLGKYFQGCIMIIKHLILYGLEQAIVVTFITFLTVFLRFFCIVKSLLLSAKKQRGSQLFGGLESIFKSSKLSIPNQREGDQTHFVLK